MNIFFDTEIKKIIWYLENCYICGMIKKTKDY